MNKRLNRRDFLKLAGALSVHTASLPFLRLVEASRLGGLEKKNILVVVFDAFSAHHISLYGYGRNTTPNISRLAERAIVYHNHYAGGSFTTPGTASLLTGTLPWTHRALAFFDKVSTAYADRSMFHVFDDYYRIAYTHNPLAGVLLDQFSASLDQHIPIEKFLLVNDTLVQDLFSRDFETASLGWSRILKKQDGASYSLFLSTIYGYYQEKKIAGLDSRFLHGLPSIRGDNYFTLEMVMDWLASNINKIPQPFLGYFHFIPPHDPYNTPVEFHNFFLNDKFRPVNKPDDIFSVAESPRSMLKKAREYDEYILYVDREFNKLFNRLEANGILKDTWIILTSDHGEMFERGIVGHMTPTLYEPVIRVPLMIFEPGRTDRLDITAKTSAIDVLPTLLHAVGKNVPDWIEGSLLPPFSSLENPPGHSIYAVQSKNTIPDSPIKQVTVSLIKGDHKLIYFAGYPKLRRGERVELFNLADDSNELKNIYVPESVLGKMMLDEMKSKLAEKNKNYL